jgi:hypothetical protein
MENHIIQPTQFHTMIQAFMDTSSKDMWVIEDNVVMHTVALEELLYWRIISLYD